MNQQIKEEHWHDPDGNPAGGMSCGVGFAISWQNGPLGRGKQRREPNGAFVESIIQAAIGRLQFYQSGKFNCEENRAALIFLDNAKEALQNRTKDREKRRVEGTHAE